MTNRLRTRRGYLTFGALMWALAMLVGVLGVGLVTHASTGAFVFVACLLTAVVAFWLWVFRRFTR